MTRVVLLLALLAVGYDAYSHQGFHTRAAVELVETGIQRLSTAVAEKPAPLPPQPTPQQPAPPQPATPPTLTP
jgi:hypothetical protein